MKTAILAASILLFALPAHAQRFGGGYPAGHLSFGGGGGFGSSGSSGSGGPGGSSFGSAVNNAPARYQIVFARGSASTYVPSTFVPYETALKMGKAALAYRPKTIAEVAAEYRASKKNQKQ